MRMSEMTEGKVYQTVLPISEIWPYDPEEVEVVLLGEGITVADLLQAKGNKNSEGSSLRIVRRPI